jgi:uncharacterized RDD family membrane protein YckC
MAKQRTFHAHETARMDALDGLPLALFPQRALGFGIDFLLMLCVWAPVVLGWKYLVSHHMHGYTKLDLHWEPHDFVSFLFLLGYAALTCWLGNGKTPGKWVAKTRVVSLTHPHMGLWQSTERALGYGASFLEAGFGFSSTSFTSIGRRSMTVLPRRLWWMKGKSRGRLLGNKFKLKSMSRWLGKLNRGTRHFHAHETARFDALSGMPLATFKQRAWAFTIDLLIIAVLRFLLGMRGHHSDEDGPLTMARLLMDAVHEIESLVEFTLYFAILLKLWNGQTLGKRYMKIRVVSLSHDHIGWWQSIERALGYGASLLEAGFGFVQLFIHRNQQCVHDRIAETIVVDENPTAQRLARVEEVEPEEVTS